MSQHATPVLDVGMVTPVGVGSAQTASSLRAGITRFTPTSLLDRRFEPFVLGLVAEEALPALHPNLQTLASLSPRQARMLRLAAPALAEAFRRVPHPARIPLLVAGPEPVPGQEEAGAFLLSHLATQAGIGFDLAGSQFFPGGRAGVFLALKEARSRLASGRVPCVAVGGVDTFVDPYVLGVLDLEGRVLAEGVIDGFRPGEGAAFLLLGAPGKASLAEVGPMAVIEGVGTGSETGHRYSQEPYRGEGLSAAFLDLFEHLSRPLEPIRVVFSGMNGESFPAKEWGVAYLRHRARFLEDARIEHPADRVGDGGAALGALMLCVAAAGVRSGVVEGPCLVWASSDHAERGAAVVARTEA